MAWAEIYFRTIWYRHPSSRLATTDMNRKMAAVPLSGGAATPSNNVAWAVVYIRTKWHLDPCSRLAAIDVG